MSLKITEGLQENEEEAKKGLELRITREALRRHCIKHNLYTTPRLNDVLYLHYKGYKTIENLEEYTGLKCIWLNHNRITSINNLDHLKNLTCLYLHYNQISKIENLSSLQNLNTINLSNNLISKLELLDTLPNLTSLYVTNNQIRTVEDINILKNCKKLSIIDLAMNHLSDHAVIKVFEVMPELRVLSLINNPIKKITKYRNIFIEACKQLTHLDEYPIFSKEREFAESEK
ncbi:hypothetical protein PGB90_007937 [Kerria lacca]